MKNRIRIYYLIFAIGVFSLTTVGATYAYWAASSMSNNVVMTNSSSYSIHMSIEPLYHGFSLIPMNNADVVKAISQGCRDKYDRGACSAYKIRVFDYSEGLDFISGTIQASTDIENLSYVIMSPNVGDGEAEKCSAVNLGTDGEERVREYCLYDDYMKFEEGTEQILVDSYHVTGVEEVELILIVWLENQDRSQNEDGLGTFQAEVTISTGSGGKIQGLIEDAIVVDDTSG